MKKFQVTFIGNHNLNPTLFFKELYAFAGAAAFLALAFFLGFSILALIAGSCKRIAARLADLAEGFNFHITLAFFSGFFFRTLRWIFFCGARSAFWISSLFRILLRSVLVILCMGRL